MEEDPKKLFDPLEEDFPLFYASPLQKVAGAMMIITGFAVTVDAYIKHTDSYFRARNVRSALSMLEREGISANPPMQEALAAAWYDSSFNLPFTYQEGKRCYSFEIKPPMFPFRIPTVNTKGAIRECSLEGRVQGPILNNR